MAIASSVVDQHLLKLSPVTNPGLGFFSEVLSLGDLNSFPSKGVMSVRYIFVMVYLNLRIFHWTNTRRLGFWQLHSP